MSSSEPILAKLLLAEDRQPTITMSADILNNLQTTKPIELTRTEKPAKFDIIHLVRDNLIEESQNIDRDQGDLENDRQYGGDDSDGSGGDDDDSY